MGSFSRALFDESNRAADRAREALEARTEERHRAEDDRGRFWRLLGSDAQIEGTVSRRQKKKMRGTTRGALYGPTGQLVGTAVRDARNLMDADSETSAEFKASLTEGPLEAIRAGRENAFRGLAAEHRSSQRGLRDAALGRGGARAYHAERAIETRSAERFGALRAELETTTAAQEAEVLGNASRYFEEFRRSWAMNATQLAMGFVDQAPGIRDEYLSAMDGLAFASADVARRESDRYLQAYQIRQQEKAANAAGGTNWGGILTSVAGLALSFVPVVGQVLGPAVAGIGGALTGGTTWVGDDIAPGYPGGPAAT